MRNTLDDIASGAIKDPMRVAARSMKQPLRKRFYKSVEISGNQDEVCVLLDRKPLKTPAGKTLSVSSRNAGELVAAEWRSQKEHIDPLSMPVTRLINTAIDGVSCDRQAVMEDIIRFAGSDLLCYRAESPAELVALQARHWDPLLDWAHIALNARFSTGTGIIHVSQPAEAIASFSAHIAQVSEPVKLASLHSLAALSGSAILAMAVCKGEISAHQAWRAAHVDEDWQISQWGEDAEAKSFRSARKAEFIAAAELLETF